MRAAAAIIAFSLAALALAFSTGGAASGDSPKSTALLTGRVFDANDRPLGNALVVVVSDDPSASRTTAVAETDAAGRFTFSDVPPGRYVLIAIHGHHSPGRSDPVVVGQFGSPFPIRLVAGDEPLAI